jgi:hypothetical protein
MYCDPNSLSLCSVNRDPLLIKTRNRFAQCQVQFSTGATCKAQKDFEALKAYEVVLNVSCAAQPQRKTAAEGGRGDTRRVAIV